jgi:CBS domain containing-hemolysin-like protein
MEVEAVRDELSIPVPDGDYETLGGYLLEIFERIPKEGEQISIDSWIFTIAEATERQIENIKCEQITEIQAPEDGSPVDEPGV